MTHKNKILNGDIMNGEWIIVNPTDCFTSLPVYECSVCKRTCSGYEPDLVCLYCGSKNKVNTKKSVSRPLIDVGEEDLYYCPTCKRILELTEIDSCMNTPNEIIDYCLKCQSKVINLKNIMQ